MSTLSTEQQGQFTPTESVTVGVDWAGVSQDRTMIYVGDLMLTVSEARTLVNFLCDALGEELHK